MKFRIQGIVTFSLFFLAGLILISVVFSKSGFARRAPQLSFEKRAIKVGSESISVEIADTPQKTALGLMYRKSIDENSGMLFVFKNSENRHFWMKNTFIPLSIGFFDQDRRLVDIQDMKPSVSEMEASPPSYESKYPAQYCLEVRQGWFQRHKVKLKDQFNYIDKK